MQSVQERFLCVCEILRQKNCGLFLRFGFLNFFDFLYEEKIKSGSTVVRSTCPKHTAAEIRARIFWGFTHFIEDLFQLLVGSLQVVVDDDNIKHARLLT